MPFSPEDFGLDSKAPNITPAGLSPEDFGVVVTGGRGVVEIVGDDDPAIPPTSEDHTAFQKAIQRIRSMQKNTGGNPTPYGYVPEGVKDTPYRRETLVRGNKDKISNIGDLSVLRALGDKPPLELEPKRSILEKIFKTLDYPGSKVRQLMTGIDPNEPGGNSFTKALNNKIGVPPYVEPIIPSAKTIQESTPEAMSISGVKKNVIPGTNISGDFVDQFNRFLDDITNPTWLQNASTKVSGTALDILSDPLMMLGPGVLTKESSAAGRNLLSIRTPAAFGMESKYKSLLPKIVDEKALGFMKEVANSAGQTRVGKVLGKGFIPGFGLPKEYYNMQRDTLDKLNYNIQKLYEKGDELFSHLNEDELKAVSHFVEGTHDINSLNLSGFDPESIQRIVTAANDYKGVRDKMTSLLLRKGLLRTPPVDDTYVPHIYPGFTDKTWFRSGPFESVREQNPFFSKARTYGTLDDAMQAGKEPLEDINEITKFYGTTAFGEINKREFIDKTLNMFGQRVNNSAQAEKLLETIGDTHDMYAPKGTFRLHTESYIPKNVLDNQGPLIKISRDDLKQGAMFTKNVPVYVLPKEIADDLNRVEKVFGNEEATKGFLKLYDNLLQFWKGRVTVTSPGFHLRNAYSNVANAYLGGLEDFSRYKKAMNVANGDSGSFAGKSYDTVLNLAQRYGVYSPTAGSWMKEIAGPEVLKPASAEQLLNPFSSRFGAVEGGRKVGSAVENNARLALFMDRLAKGDSPANAAMWTKKYLFDYSELTPFERNIMKRSIPFYTWARKNIALQAEGLLNNPKLASMAAKVTDNEYGNTDKTPMDLLPQDFQTALTIPITPGKNPTMAKLDLPIGDLEGGKMGFSPVFSIAKDIYGLVADRDKPDKSAPELIQFIYDNLPDSVTDKIDPKPTQTKFLHEPAIAMDPRVMDIMQQLTPILSRTSRLIPTDENLADPNYTKRLSSFFTGIPIGSIDLRESAANKQIVAKGVINAEISRAIKEGTINPKAVQILRNYFKITP